MPKRKIPRDRFITVLRNMLIVFGDEYDKRKYDPLYICHHIPVTVLEEARDLLSCENIKKYS